VNNPLTSLAVALMTALLLFSFSGYQLTGETAGTRLLGRLASSLVELERWVPTHRDDMQLLARDRPGENVLIDDLPIDVLLPSEAVVAVGEDDTALTLLLRESMGRRLYAEGHGALQDEEGGTHLGVTEPVRWTISLLDSGTHATWRLALMASALLTAVFAASFLVTRRSPLASMAAGAGIAVVVAFLAWLAARVIGSSFDSALDREIALILRDGAWLGLRNSLAAAAILLALLYLYNALVAPRLRREDEYYWPESEEFYDDEPYDAYPSEDSPQVR
jgi:hypothetical protein